MGVDIVTQIVNITAILSAIWGGHIVILDHIVSVHIVKCHIVVDIAGNMGGNIDHIGIFVPSVGR